MMRRSRLCKKQIVCTLRSVKLALYLRSRIGSIVISSATFYKWKPKYGGLGNSQGAGRRHGTPHFVYHPSVAANVDSLLIAGNPAAGRRPGATSLRYPRLPDRARSIRSDRCCALRLSDARLARRGNTDWRKVKTPHGSRSLGAVAIV